MRFIILAIILSSCSAQWHLRKAITKDPSIIDTVKVVTIDTVWMEVKKIDTVFKFNFDTVFFVKDSVKVKFFYQNRDSLVYLDVDCPDCPSIKTTEKKTTIIEVESKAKRITWIILGIAVGIGIFLIIKRI